jgi:hypothetical protein
MLFLRWTAGIAGARFPASVLPRLTDVNAAWRGFATLMRSRNSALTL